MNFLVKYLMIVIFQSKYFHLVSTLPTPMTGGGGKDVPKSAKEVAEDGWKPGG
jgi:hypothetical protein